MRGGLDAVRWLFIGTALVTLAVNPAFGWLVSLVLGAIITTWLFDRSRRSLLVVVLFHAAMNTAFATDPAGGVVTSGVGMLVTLLGIVAAVALWFRSRRVPAD